MNTTAAADDNARLPLTPSLERILAKVTRMASRRRSGLADSNLVGSPKRCEQLVAWGYLEKVWQDNRWHYRPLP